MYNSQMTEQYAACCGILDRIIPCRFTALRCTYRELYVDTMHLPRATRRYAVLTESYTSILCTYRELYVDMLRLTLVFLVLVYTYFYPTLLNCPKKSASTQRTQQTSRRHLLLTPTTQTVYIFYWHCIRFWQTLFTASKNLAYYAINPSLMVPRCNIQAVT